MRHVMLLFVFATVVAAVSKEEYGKDKHKQGHGNSEKHKQLDNKMKTTTFEAATVTMTTTTPTQSKSGDYAAGTDFLSGDVIKSENGHVFVRFEDSYFEVYCGDQIIWKIANVYYAVNFKFDREGRFGGVRSGNFGTDVVWSTASFTFVGEPILRISNEGFIGIYDSKSTTPLWKSESQCPGSNPCDSYPCLNGGSCEQQRNSYEWNYVDTTGTRNDRYTTYNDEYSCQCHDNSTGENCEITTCSAYMTSPIRYGFAPNCTDGNNIGSRCYFSCEEGFTLSDDPDYGVSCNAYPDRTYWSGKYGSSHQPYCVGCKNGDCTKKSVFKRGDEVKSENGLVTFRLNYQGRLELLCGDTVIWYLYSSFVGYEVNFSWNAQKLDFLSKVGYMGRQETISVAESYSGHHFVGEPILRVSNEGFIGIYDSKSTTPLWKSESQCPGPDPCDSSPCLNGATCTRVVENINEGKYRGDRYTDEYECSCADGSIGDNCEITSCPDDLTTTAIPHGFTPSCSNGSRLGSVCIFQCEDGYTLSTTTDTMICDDDDAEWRSTRDGPHRASPVCAGCRDGVCPAGTVLEKLDEVRSENGHVSLTLNKNGYLKLFCDNTTVWEVFGSKQYGRRVRFDRQGRFEMFNGRNRLRWKIPDVNHDFVGEPLLKISNEGFIGIYDSNSTTPLWKSESSCPGLNPCDSSPCLNGGSCTRKSGVREVVRNHERGKLYNDEYTCTCPESTTGESCETTLGCGSNGHILEATSTTKYIQSPNYPNNYDNNMDCTWYIKTSSDASISVQVVDIGLEDCCDHLEVDEDRDLSKSRYHNQMLDNQMQLMGKCDRWENVRAWTTEDMNATYTARRITELYNNKYTTLAIRFSSDCIYSDRGFRMSYVRSEYEYDY